MTYSQIWEYVANHFDLNQYFIAEDLLYDVKNMFNKSGSYFPPEAEELIKRRFALRDEYTMMKQRQQEDQQAVEMLGSGQVMQSITDEIVENLQNPKSEIMDIDMTQYATTKESVVPPEIKKFIEQETGIRGRIRGFFRRLFGR